MKLPHISKRTETIAKYVALVTVSLAIGFELGIYAVRYRDAEPLRSGRGRKEVRKPILESSDNPFQSVTALHDRRADLSRSKRREQAKERLEVDYGKDADQTRSD